MVRLASIALAATAATGCTTAMPDPELDVFGHSWQITVASSTVSQSEPDGTAWDIDGSPPDPYAKVYFDDNEISTTSTVSDSFTATWDDVIQPMVIVKGDKLRVEEYDADTFGDGDAILVCPGPEIEISADALRAGMIECNDSGSTLLVELLNEDPDVGSGA
jgi:hypothetical protein